MNKELFGVFGSLDELCRFRSTEDFDRVVEGEIATVGIRDLGLDIPHRSTAYTGEYGTCIVWGEVYLPARANQSPAQWVLQQYRQYGQKVLSELNGSYLVFLECDGEAVLFTDPIRSWECFYTDDPGVRVFGTDALQVGSTISNGTISVESMFELAHISVVLGDRTLLKELERVPFDGYLTAKSIGILNRFKYHPQQFDYVNELSHRLYRALQRRSQLPGRKGLLLGAGYDSRILLAGVSDIDQCFTIGEQNTPEVQVAKQLSDQYNVCHDALTTNNNRTRYNFDIIQYTNGISESIHVHQRGLNDVADVDTIYHGWGIDTFLKDFFIQKQRIGIRGKSVRRSKLPNNPKPMEFLIEKRLGIMPENAQLLAEYASRGYCKYNIEAQIEKELSICRNRCSNEHNVANMFGIKNIPSKAFRIHLADNYLESFLCADTELIDWHLRTPPQHRSTTTFIKAIQQLDPEILRYRPPDRPRSVLILNPIEGFLRRILPMASSFGQPWPDSSQLYDQYNFDQAWFPNFQSAHLLSARSKFRIHDVVTWINTLREESITPDDVLCLGIT